jgi:hypothetical protein
VICEIDERRCPDGDKDVGSQTRATLAILPLGADQGSEHEGRQQADQRVEEIIKLEGLDEAHYDGDLRAVGGLG